MAARNEGGGAADRVSTTCSRSTTPRIGSRSSSSPTDRPTRRRRCSSCTAGASTAILLPAWRQGQRPQRRSRAATARGPGLRGRAADVCARTRCARSSRRSPIPRSAASPESCSSTANRAAARLHDWRRRRRLLALREMAAPPREPGRLDASVRPGRSTPFAASCGSRCPAETILDDVLAPMQAVLAGARVVFEGSARAPMTASPPPRPAEFGRKTRTLAGNYQLLRLQPRLLVPFVNPVWIQFVSHKLGRLVVPYALCAHPGRRARRWRCDTLVRTPSRFAAQLAFYGLRSTAACSSDADARNCASARRRTPRERMTSRA